MSLLLLSNELLIIILAELEVNDVISVLETHPDLYQISFQCLRNRTLDLKPYCESGDISRVRLLLQAGANADSFAFHFGSPLYNAAENGHEEVVKLLLEHGAQANHDIHYKLLPLQAAARKGYFAIVKLLIDHGADVNSMDSLNPTALDETIRYKGQYSYSKEGPWKRRGLCLHRNPQTPFSYYHTIKLLLEFGADVHIDQALRTAVLAYPHLQQDTVHLLLNYGANPNARAHRGVPLLHLINPTKPTYDCRSAETAIILLNHGADVNARDEDEQTPLHIAAYGDTQGETLAAVYLAHHANVIAADIYGITPLHLAVAKEGSRANIRVIELLLKSGADVNARSTKGKTPRYYAVEKHAPNEVVELLLEYGADWNISSQKDDSDTPLKKFADRVGDITTLY
ncbi:hypothetical protein PITC_089890 [Penicillium italicum]|uniref:Uncharacterized protein n=1 Tax=Penicillium italicum TaxID=40296 RepID=A0A0A2LK08_PENIT|nr:hypothetical protein PITC_089890 [Penicillium italicum]